ncbi:MAG: hypothetical protein AAFR61_25410 [Bacteroidota bacterium]
MNDLNEERAFTSQCLIQKIGGECAGTHPALREAANTQLAAMLSVFEGTIRAGQDAGEFRTDIPVARLAKYLHAQLYGAHTLARLSHDRSVMDQGLQMALTYISS